MDRFGVNVPAIAVGNEAINRASATSAGNTVVILDGSAIAATGVITAFNLYVATATTGTKVGIFYLVSGTTYMCRSAYTAGNLGTGLNQLTGLNLRCVIGDRIGYYQGSAGALDRADTGGTMAVYNGDACTVGVSQSYTSGSRLISINASGYGWSTISKVCGVTAANTAKVSSLNMNTMSKLFGIST